MKALLLGVMADDLTGAGDAAVCLARAGLKTVILTRLGAAGRFSVRGWEAVVINTGSRLLPPAQAARRAGCAARWLGRRAGLVYQKVDSALRGNLRAELAAARRALGVDHYLFVPAFPRMGRTTKGGIHRIEGVPVARSVFGRDPATPVRESRVAALLGAEAVAAETPEVVRQRDLQAAARRIGREPNAERGRMFAAGSAGFLEAVVPWWVNTGRRSADRASWSARNGELRHRRPAALVACGSLHPAARRQVRELRARVPAATVLVTPGRRVRNGGRALNRLAARAAAEIRRGRAGRVVLVGGATAEAVCGRMRWHALRVVRGLAPGTVLAVPVGGPHPREVVLKPGSFGDRLALVKAAG